MPMCTKYLLRLLLVLMPLADLQAIDFYVAPSGDDQNSGTETKPYATLERARKAIRALKETGALPDRNGSHVYLRSGQYRFSKSFALNEDDSGTLESPIIYSAYPDEKVILTGGVDIPLAKFTLVADPKILSRLPAESHGKVWTVNLNWTAPLQIAS